jgi:hypothetical protein
MTNSSDPAVSQKYTRPRRFFSPIGVILGVAFGLAIGLFVSWYIVPVEQVDVAPWQLTTADRDRYMVAIALAYAQDGDLNRAVNRLLELRLPGDPIQAMADTACALATSGYVNSTSGLQAVRSMIRLYQPQGRAGCADTLISADGAATQIVEVILPTSTLTLTPAASKTATPESQVLSTPTPLALSLPTPESIGAFEAISVNTSCSVQESGLIQVYVYEINGSTGVPGQPVRVRWNGGESRFFTGLIPERGDAYADFQMEEGQSYLVDMPDRADAVDTTLPAVPCTDPTTGERAITTYRVIFRALS